MTPLDQCSSITELLFPVISHASVISSCSTTDHVIVALSLRSCLRRMDLRGGPADFDEAEYSEAGAVLVAVSGQLAGSCRMGWRLPWGVRVRVCESLLTGVNVQQV